MNSAIAAARLFGRRGHGHRLQRLRVPSVERFGDHHAAADRCVPWVTSAAASCDGELLLQRLRASLQRLVVALQPLHRRRHLIGRHGQVPLRRRQRLAPGTEPSQRAIAAQKLDARAAPELLPAADRDDADRARPGHVGAAARRQIEVLDVDQPQPSGPSRLLSQRQRRGLLR